MFSALIAIMIGACVGVWFSGNGKLTMEALPAAVIGGIGGFIGGWLVKTVLMLIPFGPTILFSAMGGLLAILLFSKLTQR